MFNAKKPGKYNLLSTINLTLVLVSSSLPSDVTELSCQVFTRFVSYVHRDRCGDMTLSQSVN